MNTGTVLQTWHAAGIFDAVCIAVLLLSIGLGMVRGLVTELSSLATWAMALFLTWTLAPAVYPYLDQWPLMRAWSTQARHVIAFVGVLVVSLVGIGLLTRFLRNALSAIGLGAIDSVLGGLYGTLRGAVLLWLVALVVLSTPLQQAAWWRDSPAAVYVVQSFQVAQPYAPDKLLQWVPETMRAPRAQLN